MSHYPAAWAGKAKRIAGTGMNALELSANNQFTPRGGGGGSGDGGDWAATDLNRDAKLPFADESFDVVTCVVSVDYLNK